MDKNHPGVYQVRRQEKSPEKLAFMRKAVIKIQQYSEPPRNDPYLVGSNLMQNIQNSLLIH